MSIPVLGLANGALVLPTNGKHTEKLKEMNNLYLTAVSQSYITPIQKNLFAAVKCSPLSHI